MRLVALASVMIALAGCVPTTKYNYVPLTRENFEATRGGEAIPLVRQSTALCLADAKVVMVREAVWSDDGICGRARDEGPPPHVRDMCFAPETVSGVGIPYEGRSASVIPMAAVQIGKCDPEKLRQ